MRFVIKNTSGYALPRLMRKIGYAPHYDSFVRRIGGADYPRFHIYAQEKGEEIVINLHLDQKRASYKGQTAHSANYSIKSDVLAREKERILAVLKDLE